MGSAILTLVLDKKLIHVSWYNQDTFLANKEHVPIYKKKQKKNIRLQSHKWRYMNNLNYVMCLSCIKKTWRHSLSDSYNILNWKVTIISVKISTFLKICL